jgi:hypothetical protein
MGARRPDAELNMRRTKIVIIDRPADGEKENRDAGKSFLLTEVSAVLAEEWGLRAMMALGTSGIIVPQEIADAGLIGFALIGYQAFMGAREDAVLPLWREMLPACVQSKPPAGENSAGATILIPWNEMLVEEVSTLMLLRQQILELHVGFTSAEIALMLRTAVSAKISASLNTGTSQE